jgi:hypothetical protein
MIALLDNLVDNLVDKLVDDLIGSFYPPEVIDVFHKSQS